MLLFVLLIGQAVAQAAWPELLPPLLPVPGPLLVWQATGAVLALAVSSS